MLGKYDLARQILTEINQRFGNDIGPSLAVVDALENPALRGRAVAMLQESDEFLDGADQNAIYFMFLGEDELALESLERAFEAGDPYAVLMNRNRLYDPLRVNPRFQAMLKKMNLLP